MAQLNYNHLHYFWVVATLGSIVKAAQALHVTPQTISGQLRTLEERVGSRLFRKQGRRLQLTDTGQLVRSYAEPMFHLGVELVDALRSGGARSPSSLNVGITPSVPRCLASRIIGAALDGESRLVCYDAAPTTLAADLAARNFDVVLTDGALKTGDVASVANHLVGECDTTLLCGRRELDRYRGALPAALAQAPFILPPRRSRLRRTLSHWLRSQKIAPRVVAEVENVDLMAAMSESSGALFAVPTTIVADVEARYDVAPAGRIAELKQQLYLIVPEAMNELALVQTVVRAAREQLLARMGSHVSLERIGAPASGHGPQNGHALHRPASLNGLQTSIRVASLRQLPRGRSGVNADVALSVDNAE